MLPAACRRGMPASSRHRYLAASASPRFMALTAMWDLATPCVGEAGRPPPVSLAPLPTAGSKVSGAGRCVELRLPLPRLDDAALRERPLSRGGHSDGLSVPAATFRRALTPAACRWAIIPRTMRMWPMRTTVDNVFPPFSEACAVAAAVAMPHARLCSLATLGATSAAATISLSRKPSL